ncbi:hypothetical protein HK100_001514 [Physocladia obscura]|uniref:Uncharacterized protein n=1 Tax=Physocladia obscura TaxID=109957 RepID=A0AAD5XK72_9FUNG|nr:hypothetical protein HK100_001514 [Physocladia obscura]
MERSARTAASHIRSPSMQRQSLHESHPLQGHQLNSLITSISTLPPILPIQGPAQSLPIVPTVPSTFTPHNTQLISAKAEIIHSICGDGGNDGFIFTTSASKKGEIQPSIVVHAPYIQESDWIHKQLQIELLKRGDSSPAIQYPRQDMNQSDFAILALLISELPETTVNSRLNVMLHSSVSFMDQIEPSDHILHIFSLPPPQQQLDKLMLLTQKIPLIRVKSIPHDKKLDSMEIALKVANEFRAKFNHSITVIFDTISVSSKSLAQSENQQELTNNQNISTFNTQNSIIRENISWSLIGAGTILAPSQTIPSFGIDKKIISSKTQEFDVAIPLTPEILEKWNIENIDQRLNSITEEGLALLDQFVSSGEYKWFQQNQQQNGGNNSRLKFLWIVCYVFGMWLKGGIDLW